MNNEDKIKDLFAEKLGQLESPVNPDLWNAIASQVGAASASAAGSAGLSIVSKVIIGIGAASVIGVGTYFLTKEVKADNKSAKPVELVQQNVSDKEASNPTENDVTISSETNDNVGRTFEVTNNVINANPVEKEESSSIETQTPILTPTVRLASENSETKIAPTVSESLNNAKANDSDKAQVVKDYSVQSKKVVEVENTQTVTPHVEAPKSTFELTKTPNIFVLNASGYFSISHKGEYQDFQFTLMDSKNRVIFSSNDPNFEWRGLDLSGTQIEPGNYIYIITAVDKNGKAINKYSPLTVINQ